MREVCAHAWLLRTDPRKLRSDFGTHPLATMAPRCTSPVTQSPPAWSTPSTRPSSSPKWLRWGRRRSSATDPRSSQPGTPVCSAHWNDMAQPRPKSTTSSSQDRTTPALRGRRAPQARNGLTALTKGMRHGRAKFLHYFPKGFRDPLYEDWERGYKWMAHERWTETLNQASFRGLLKAGKHRDIAAQAVAIEARTNLLFSFEKMALRDAVKPLAGPGPLLKAFTISSMAQATWSNGSPIGARWWRGFPVGRRGF